MIVYAAAVVLSACLLFLVQPLITKLIFPWFGGTSAVWIAALMFFQVCLLCGYAYAHALIAWASRRQQFLIHGALLLLACITLPIIPADTWRPDDSSRPAAGIFVLLAAHVGLPCLLLSATSPLLQAWYVRMRGGGIPLWLFAVSNIGSLAALLSFPLLLEPSFTTRSLAIFWSAAFAVFAGLCAWLAWRQQRAEASAATPAPTTGPVPGWLQMLLWVLFAAAASALLAAATTQLSANVAPVPLLWVVPLSVYLLTFIVVFSFPRFYAPRPFLPLMLAALGCMAWLYANAESHQDIRYVIPLYLGSMFVLCLGCHGELARRAPPAIYLTRFYLLIALGGALGGFFVAVIAPLAFDSYAELPIVLIVIVELLIVTQWRRQGAGRALWPLRIAMIAGGMYLAAFLLAAERRNSQHEMLMTRNFYGVLRVREYVENDTERRGLVHGTINHGYELKDPTQRDRQVAYYAPGSGVAAALQLKQAQGPVRVGVIGLGVGVLANYARQGDEFSLYEIDPSVIDIAQTHFTYLQRARDRGADVRLLEGDARLTLDRQSPQHFDVLIVDAFSSDAIPVHLLTHEAFALYFSHLRQDGLLAVHISNRYLDLAPVCIRAAQAQGRSALLIHGSRGVYADTSNWVLMASDASVWSAPQFEGLDIRPMHADPSFNGWTDQYSSLWEVLKME